MPTKRQRIVEKIIERMRGITTAAGYETDLGASVYDAETAFDDTELPALAVFDLIGENQNALDDPAARLQKLRLPVQFRIFVNSRTRAGDIRRMLGDIQTAIARDRTWDALAIASVLSREGLVIDDQSNLAGGAIEIEIIYLTQAFNAYQ